MSGKLRFEVASCSSEDAAFPARELNEHAASSRGYMTARHCEYPQELVLRLLDGRCRLTQVQLLSHQTNIATKIELFLSRDAELSTAQFQRLGYLTLKSNVESNYMARELKTVHIDNEALWVRLVLHQCYINERNINSQVGIMAVNLCGEPLELQQGELPNQSSGEVLNATASQTQLRSILKPNAAPSASADDLSFDLRFDAKTAARIREIQIAKDQAVASEDYDQAKRLKQMEEQLKSIGLQLTRLEAQKRDAVANEDYDLAKQIKDEIAMLEASVGSNETQPIGAATSGGYSSQSPSAAGKKGLTANRSQVLPRAGAAAVLGTKGMSSSSNFSPRDMYPDDSSSSKRKGGDPGAYFDGESPVRPNSGRRLLPQDDEDDEPSYGQRGGGGGQNAEFEGIPDAENLPEPDEIPPALAKENEQMIGVIGEFFTRCFYSNLWNHRDAAIRKVTMEMENYPVDTMELLDVCSTMVQGGAGDRIAQVALSAFRLLERMLAFGSRVRRDDMIHILGNSMTQVVTKLGDPQTKVRDEASTVLKRLAAAKNVGVVFVSSHLVKRSKKPLGLKLLLGRLLVMNDLIAGFDLVPNSDHSVGGVMSFLEDSNAFAHQNREIRDVAKEISVALYQIVGDEVEGYLKSLRPKQLEEYQMAFEEAASAGPATKAARSNAPAGRSGGGAANGGGGGGGGGGAGRGNARAKLPEEMMDYDNDNADENDDEEESVDEYTCPFCGVVDEKFDSDLLDQHFWAACRMLTPCKMCGQVIEIAGLNEHLLVECELKKNHKECPRCGEAITSKFFDKHVSVGDCLPRPHPKKANRCPLCHEDVAPGKSGWQFHLLEEGCANNPRS